MNRRGLPALAILGIALICQVCAAQEITVAAAADLQSAMQDVAARFERETGKKVKVIFGSSGNFFQQIQNGAPFDMFFSVNVLCLGEGVIRHLAAVEPRLLRIRKTHERRPSVTESDGCCRSNRTQERDGMSSRRAGSTLRPEQGSGKC